jgi:hypothetical protein
MSADDWQQCPICHGMPKELRGGIEHLYGKIPEKEYERRKYEYKKALNTSTVRVYYEYLLLKDKTIFLTMYAKCEKTWG